MRDSVVLQRSTLEVSERTIKSTEIAFQRAMASAPSGEQQESKKLSWSPSPPPIVLLLLRGHSEPRTKLSQHSGTRIMRALPERERADTDAGFRARLPSLHCRSLHCWDGNGNTSICARHGSFARGLLTRRAVKDEHRERRAEEESPSAIAMQLNRGSHLGPPSPSVQKARSLTRNQDHVPHSHAKDCVSHVRRMHKGPTAPRTTFPAQVSLTAIVGTGIVCPDPFLLGTIALGHSLVSGCSPQSNATRTHHGAVDIAFNEWLTPTVF